MQTCNDCKYLKPKEIEQDALKLKGNHKCIHPESLVLYVDTDRPNANVESRTILHAGHHPDLPTPEWCPLPRWKYHTTDIRGGLHDALYWLNENANHLDVIEMKSTPSKVYELGYNEGFTTIVWREKI